MKLIEVAAGLALVVGKFVPLALVAIAPIIVNIVGFHLMMEREGTWLALYLLTLAAFIAWNHRASFRTLIQANRPGSDRQ